MSANSFLEKLLDGTGVEWLPLVELAQVLNGWAFKSAMYTDSGIRVIRISDVQKGAMSDKNLKFYPISSKPEIEKYLLEDGDLVMSLTGNVGRVAVLSKGDLPAALNQRVACLRARAEKTHTRYLFHYLNRTSFENEAMANASGGGQKNLSTGWLSSFAIPIPYPEDPKKSLAEQARIVAILDTFDTVTHSISEGLPREIELRQQQYEYYRDLLLNFPKPAQLPARAS